jgi:hypothetical protein
MQETLVDRDCDRIIQNPNQLDLAKFGKFIENHFNPDELQVLCFDTKIPYDNLKGATHEIKSRELVGYARRREKLSALFAEVKSKRPFIDCADLLTSHID